MPRITIRRFASALALLGVTCLSLLTGAGTASAHADLVSADPVAGQAVPTAPTTVTIRYSESVETALGAIRVFGPHGDRVDVGQVSHPSGKGDTIQIGLKPGLPDGTYTVAWSVVSADSHPVQGAYTFGVGNVTVAAPSMAAGHSGSGGLAVLYGTVRWVAFAGFTVLVGAAYFVAACWPAGASQRPTRVVLTAGWAALFLGSLLALLIQGPYGANVPLTRAVDPTILRATLGTRLGTALLIRIFLLGLGAGGLAVLLARVESLGRRARLLATGGVLAGSAAVAATWSGADHSGVGSQVVIAFPVDVAHLVAMGVWIGGLVILVGVLLRSGNATAMKDAMLPFSRTAAVCVGVLLVTGTYQSWRQVGSFAALGGSTYGRLLLAKIVLVLVLAALGAAARAWVLRHYIIRAAGKGRPEQRLWVAPAKQEIVALRRSVFAEVGIAVVVIALAVVISGSEPARSSYIQPAIATVAYDTGSGANRAGKIKVVVDAPRIGSTSVHLTVADPAGRPLDLPEVQAALYLAAKQLGPMPLKLTRTGIGSYVATDVPFSFPGRWQVAVDVRTSEIDETTVAAPVNVQ